MGRKWPTSRRKRNFFENFAFNFLQSRQVSVLLRITFDLLHTFYSTLQKPECVRRSLMFQKKLYYMVCLAEHVVSVCVYMSSMFHCPTFQNTVFECKSSLYGFVLLPDYNKTIQE